MKPLVNLSKVLFGCMVFMWLSLEGLAGTAFSAHIGTLGKTVTDKDGKPVILYKESHALIIGISNYTAGWPSLPGVKKDVEEVQAALEAQGFKVEVKMDLTNTELDQAFDDFISRYGHNPENRLLFYFAGHGHTVRATYGDDLGYIVPADAPNPNKDLPTFQRTAMEMQQIEIYAKRVQAKHALFLFDACFSGTLFALSRAVPEIINYKTSQPVRQFITSGSADEVVPDASIFRAQFTRALQGEADTDKDGYVTGTELGEFLQTTVVNYSYNTQHPQYGKIRNPNLDKGDLVFIIPQDKQMEEVIASAVEEPPEVTFSFEDLEIQVKWQKYLSQMEEAFAKVEEYERVDIPVDSKIIAWKQFLNAFANNNPYSNRDDVLRNTAQARIEQWKSGAIVTPSSVSQPEQLPPKEQVFRINRIVLKNAKSKILEPEDEIYTLKVGETVTISIEAEYSREHYIVVTWSARNGKVFPTPELINIYTAQKAGPDVVVIYLWNEDTGDELEESIIITVVE